VDPSAVLPVVNPDGSWYYPFQPGWVFADNPPSQDAYPEWADDRVLGNAAGSVIVQHIRIPTMVPNFGVPGTSVNVRTVAQAGINVLGFSAPGFLDAVIGFFRLQGETVLGGAIYEYADTSVSPNMLGWEIDIVMVAPAGAQMYADGYYAQPQLQIIAIIGAMIGIYAFLNDVTNGAFGNALNQIISSLSHGISQVVAAPFQGAAELLLVGGALVLGIAWLGSRGGVSPEAISAAGGAVAGAGQAGGAILAGGGQAVSATTGVLTGRGGGGGAAGSPSRRRSRS
jgi:hypothetical protein